MSAFAKYRKHITAPLTRTALEKWREKFAQDVVRVAESSANRDEFLKRLHDELKGIGFEFVKLGSGSSRAAFALPFSLVAKLHVGLVETFIPYSSERPYCRERPSITSNAAELERSRLFPAFVPKVYGDAYRTCGNINQAIDLLVTEQLIPIAGFFDEITTALGSTSAANLGIDPFSGRLMVLDLGVEWAAGTEEALIDGTHPLMRFPFMRERR